MPMVRTAHERLKCRLKLLVPVFLVNFVAWVLVLKGMPLRSLFYPYWGPVLTLTMTVLVATVVFNGFIFFRYSFRIRKAERRGSESHP